MDFVRDFLFTNLENHLEFFEFIQNLEKEDDILLIGLLERLIESSSSSSSSQSDNNNDNLPRLGLPVEPFSSLGGGGRKGGQGGANHGNNSYKDSLIMDGYYGSIPTSDTTDDHNYTTSMSLTKMNERVNQNQNESTMTTPLQSSSSRTVKSSKTKAPKRRNNINTKNPLRIAQGYAALQSLNNHNYNIYEYAYLVSAAKTAASTTTTMGRDNDNTTSSTTRTREKKKKKKSRALVTQWMALFSVITQLTFLIVLISYNIIEQQIFITPNEDFFAEVVFIMIVSTALFVLTLRLQFVHSYNFVSTMKELQQQQQQQCTQLVLWSNILLPNFYLFLNIIINQIVGICIFFFNIYFILVSDTPTNAVLNSVALAFIVEIDDHFKPNWNTNKLQLLLAKILYTYCSNNNDWNDGKKDQQDNFIDEDDDVEENAIIVEREGPSIRTQADKFYVQLVLDGQDDEEEEEEEEEDDGRFSVVVYASSRKDPRHHVTVTYERTVYHVFGPKARDFRTALLKFHCWKNFPTTTVPSSS